MEAMQYRNLLLVGTVLSIFFELGRCSGMFLCAQAAAEDAEGPSSGSSDGYLAAYIFDP